jgi:TRAP-type C4-dicarboxylate transport system permease small subunit
MHVAIDLISSKLSEKGKRSLSSSINIIVATFSLLALVIGGSRLVYITFDLGQNSPALQVPLALVYLIIPISGLLIIFYKISDIFKKQ